MIPNGFYVGGTVNNPQKYNVEVRGNQIIWGPPDNDVEMYSINGNVISIGGGKIPSRTASFSRRVMNGRCVFFIFDFKGIAMCPKIAYNIDYCFNAGRLL